MEYRRLPFEQYFINTSEDFNHRGAVSYPVKYAAVSYSTSSFGRLFGIQHEVNYEIHYEEDRNVIQLNFQRTVGFSDWVANVGEFAVKYYDFIEFDGQPLQLRVHRGWGDMYLTIKRDVRKQWQILHEQYPEAETEILGWSLGSGQAILCCQDLNYNFGLKAHLFTFGSVRPFKAVRSNADLMRKYLGSLCKECWNFADVNDIVTYMPPFRGFLMINRVDVGTDLRRSFFRLLNPYRYHTGYDQAGLYAGFYDDARGYEPAGN
ncbi:MAG: hypothetical protein K6C09_00405 [Oscillospiraceae bacterium]|nr:hypothetical protein [Oscillospiraceae bacterium]